MCPIWFQEHGTRGDEAASIDNGIPAKSLDRIREKRAAILSMLEDAAKMDPANVWVFGQRIRLSVDQKEYARAAVIAAEECRQSRAVCAMLEGYVSAASGNRKGAEAAFTYAAAAMTPAERCGYLDATVFFDPTDRLQYEQMPCAQHMPLDDRFWWLADPLWIRPGNERLAVHLERQALLMLKSSLTADEHFDYRVKFGGASVAEMLLRYGWPSVSFYHRQEHENHNGWLGFRDSASNASHEYFRPRYHTTPPLAVVSDPTTLAGPELADIAPPWIERKKSFDEFWWPLEHFARPGPIVAVDYQAALFRRMAGPLIAVAADPRSQRLRTPELARYTTALVAMRGPADTARSSTTPTKLEPTGATVATLRLRPGQQVVSTEILDLENDSATTARARFSVKAPPGLDSLARGEIGISDAVLFAAPASDQAMPVSANDAVERMLPSTNLGALDRVGIFVELYGLAAGESTEVTLSVIGQDQPGFLRRLGAKVGVGEASAGSFLARWEAGKPGTSEGKMTIDGAVVNTRAIIINVSNLRAGLYAMEISVSRGGQSALTRREFRLTR